jgi:hypothetical protein
MALKESNQRIWWGQDFSANKRYFLEAELSLVSTLIDIARGRYQRGNRRDGDRSKAHAEKAIETTRYFIQSNYLSPALKALFERRCDELEQAVAALTDHQGSG